MQIIKEYVRENSKILFEHQPGNNLKAIFDNNGFFFSAETQLVYNQVKNQPHIYVAWTKNTQGHYYVGKSFQKGGRWKRQHAYHLGTLAHHLHNTIRYDDQNHIHWIKYWMNSDSITAIAANTYTIELKELVYICFIPFELYSNHDYRILQQIEIKKINTNFEKKIIQSYRDDDIHLLNVQHN